MRNWLIAVAAACSLQALQSAEMKGNCHQFCVREGYNMSIYAEKTKKCFCGDLYDMDTVLAPVIKSTVRPDTVIYNESDNYE
jgi:hypothetical protein